jgi:hypothetical protein
MKRRGFLKSIAALFPAAAASTIVAKQADAVPKQERPRPAPEVCYANIKRPSSLKADRHVNCQYNAGFCDFPAEKGMVVEIAKFTPNPMGGQYPVVRPGSHSGQPLGILVEDVVQMDPSRVPYFESMHNNHVQVGGKVTVVQDGWVTVGPFDGPVEINQRIYYDNAGRLTTRPNGKPIGVAMSTADADGYVKVRVSLYVNESAELPSPN